ncbi:MAG: diadenylate cyclase CdaA [Oscillospiraceae bacterium]|nr:diadenylate cyclase CdaA [Oscillospiraceae bacterium]
MPFDGFEIGNFIYIRLDSVLDVVKAVFEILCITYFIYIIFNLFRETRAWQLLKGVLLIVVITAVANIVELRTLAFMLNNTFGFLAIGMVVVFQPELRRGLEQIGRSALQVFFNVDAVKSTRNIADSAIRACSAMSKTFTGALIVFERQTKLGEIIDTGIVLGADVSSELLVNIFTKNAPLHDGAVVIRDLRIEAATCYLPLTNDSSVDRELGTRHRAAIGITEITDAIVLVVSEETGRISFVINGVINRGLSEDALRNQLIEGLEEFAAPARRISFLKSKAK